MPLPLLPRPYLVTVAAGPPMLVDADTHTVEQDCLVLRRVILAWGRPCWVIALRVPMTAVLAVETPCRDGVLYPVECSVPAR